MMTTALDRAAVQDYYGKILQTSSDLKTTACCCSDDALSPRAKAALAEIEPEVLARFYGCGAPLPALSEGLTILDLGCGAGRDAYLAARLAGPGAHVIGVDMTPEQIAVARQHLPAQMARFGYATPNVEFRLGLIEDLAALGLTDNSVDLVISNCVLNLSPAKEAVFAEIFRVLKPGGELYFSDVFADRRVPANLQTDAVLHGECLAGAMYGHDFRRLLRKLGILDFRKMNSRPIALQNPEVEAKIGMVNFTSETIRAFKLDLEDICEDYGQVATYHGTIADHPHWFDLDDHHRFFTGKPMLVCGNSAAMVSQTRFGAHFSVVGDKTVHHGAFPCGPAPTNAPVATTGGGCC